VARFGPSGHFGLTLPEFSDPLLALVIEAFTEVGGLDRVGGCVGFSRSAGKCHPTHRNAHRLGRHLGDIAIWKEFVSTRCRRL
jgi:hypothetical protein